MAPLFAERPACRRGPCGSGASRARRCDRPLLRQKLTGANCAATSPLCEGNGHKWWTTPLLPGTRAAPRLPFGRAEPISSAGLCAAGWKRPQGLGRTSVRLTLTVVDPYGGDSADVVLDADPESTVGTSRVSWPRRSGTPGPRSSPSGTRGRRPPGTRRWCTSTGMPSTPPRPSSARPCATGPSCPSRTPPDVCPASRPASSSCASSAGPPPASCTGSASGATTSAAATPRTSASTTPRSRPAR